MTASASAARPAPQVRDLLDAQLDALQAVGSYAVIGCEPDGNNIWVSHGGQVVKCSQEQRQTQINNQVKAK